MHNELHCNYALPETLLERWNYGEWDGQFSMHAWEWEREKKKKYIRNLVWICVC